MMVLWYTVHMFLHVLQVVNIVYLILRINTFVLDVTKDMYLYWYLEMIIMNAENAIIYAKLAYKMTYQNV